MAILPISAGQYVITAIRHRDFPFVWLFKTLDIAVPITLFYFISALLNIPWSDKYTAMGLVGGLTLNLFNQATGIYNGWERRTLSACSTKLLQTWALTWVCLLILALLLEDTESISLFAVTLWSLLTPLGLVAYRVGIRLGQVSGKSGRNKQIAIIGAGELGKRIAITLREAAMPGNNPITFYDDAVTRGEEPVAGIPVAGTIDELLALQATEAHYDETYITLPLQAENRIKQILHAMTESSVTVKFIPDLFSFRLLHSRLYDIDGMPIISIYDSPLNSTGHALLKRTEDILLSLMFLLLTSPLFLLLALGVKLTSPGPIFYKQIRIGLNGKEFPMYKFRSMPVDAERDGAIWGDSEDKTTTRFGSIIRKTCLDELPQFLNVLVGNMSIVGPRPERDIFVEGFRKEIPRYMQKHLVKAGITGWAQINGWRGNTSLEKRIEFDLQYIENWALWLDLKIIFLTFMKVFSFRKGLAPLPGTSQSTVRGAVRSEE